MRRLTVFVLCMLLAAVTSPPAQASPGEEPEAGPELSIVGKNQGDKPEDFHFRMGNALQVEATGDLVEKIKAEWAKTKLIALYFNGEPIAALKSPPHQSEAGSQILLNFTLERNAGDDANRQAWERFFRKETKYLMPVLPALAMGNDLPLVVHSSQPLRFYVASNRVIWLMLILGLAALAGSFWYMVTKTKMLRDAESNYYSLGKSQMAFWGLLVALSFVGVWILTGTMERIPQQALILLGISGATGLSAVVIGNSKKKELQTKFAEKNTKLVELKQEEQNLQAQQLATPPAAGGDRRAVIAAEVAAREQELAELTKKLEPGASQGFWRDICDDGGGASFHRLQVVIWTVVLGAVFVHSVARVMSMPEFPDTLLTLMGISNATYLGFKIPEKP